MNNYILGGLIFTSSYLVYLYIKQAKKLTELDTQLLFDQQITNLSLFKNRFGVSKWHMCNDNLVELLFEQPKIFKISIYKENNSICIFNKNNNCIRTYKYSTDRQETQQIWDNLNQDILFLIQMLYLN